MAVVALIINFPCGFLLQRTTAQDIIDAVSRIGVSDIQGMCFHPPNKSCIISFGSEDSQRMCFDGLGKLKLHNRKPVVTLAEDVPFPPPNIALPMQGGPMPSNNVEQHAEQQPELQQQQPQRSGSPPNLICCCKQLLCGLRKKHCFLLVGVCIFSLV